MKHIVNSILNYDTSIFFTLFVCTICHAVDMQVNFENIFRIPGFTKLIQKKSVKCRAQFWSSVVCLTQSIVDIQNIFKRLSAPHILILLKVQFEQTLSDFPTFALFAIVECFSSHGTHLIRNDVWKMYITFAKIQCRISQIITFPHIPHINCFNIQGGLHHFPFFCCFSLFVSFFVVFFL